MSSSNDFFSESVPPDPDSDEEDDEGDGKGTNWLDMWALCISVGISDSEWCHLTIPKVRAIMKLNKMNQEFEIILHGGEIKNKKPRKAMYLSDLGFYPKL